MSDRGRRVWSRRAAYAASALEAGRHRRSTRSCRYAVGDRRYARRRGRTRTVGCTTSSLDLNELTERYVPSEGDRRAGVGRRWAAADGDVLPGHRRRFRGTGPYLAPLRDVTAVADCARTPSRGPSALRHGHDLRRLNSSGSDLGTPDLFTWQTPSHPKRFRGSPPGDEHTSACNNSQ